LINIEFSLASAELRRSVTPPAAIAKPLRWPAMESLLNVVQVMISVILIFLVLLHSGKDSGLSGAFGIGQSGSSFGGGSLVERNLDRWTIFFAILFVLNTIVLLKI
jgi:preprotein translocase subunit SecG